MGASQSVNIVISATGAQQVVGQTRAVTTALSQMGSSADVGLSGIAAGAERASGGMSELVKRAHLYLGGMTLVSQVQKAVAARDEFVGLRARLDLLAGSARGDARAMAEITEIAQRPGVGCVRGLSKPMDAARWQGVTLGQRPERRFSAGL